MAATIWYEKDADLSVLLVADVHIVVMFCVKRFL